MADQTSSAILTFGIRVGPLELYWTEDSKMLAVKGIENWDQCRSLIEHIVGKQAMAQFFGGPQPTVFTASSAGPAVVIHQPQSEQAKAPPADVAPPAAPPPLKLVPDAAREAHAQPPPKAANGAHAQPANRALPEDAVFGRMTKLQEVADELVKRAIAAKPDSEITSGDVVKMAQELMGRSTCPVLSGIAADDFQDRVESAGLSALIMAGR